MTSAFPFIIYSALAVGLPAFRFVIQQSAIIKDDAERLKFADSHAILTKCGCWNPFSSLKIEDCCTRTDAGSLNWKDGEQSTCDAIDGCEDYCYWRCSASPHKNDKQGMLEYLGEKVSEVQHFEEADVLLARASWQAQYMAEKRTQAFIPVHTIHPLHPVGGWRAETWAKTEKRKDAVLKARDLIVKAGNKLTQETIDTNDDLKPMRSVTPFIAVPFNFCGYKHVLLEGNGRLKGMQLAEEEAAAAAEEAGALQDMQVEVTMLQFPTDKLATVQEGIAELWNVYAKESDGMKNDTDDESLRQNELKIKEYDTFRVGVARCTGEATGLFGLGKTEPCPLVDRSGEVIDEMKPGQLFGVAGKFSPPNGPDMYQLCSDQRHGPVTNFVRAKNASVVLEFCPTCVSVSDSLPVDTTG